MEGGTDAANPVEDVPSTDQTSTEIWARHDRTGRAEYADENAAFLDATSHDWGL